MTLSKTGNEELKTRTEVTLLTPDRNQTSEILSVWHKNGRNVKRVQHRGSKDPYLFVFERYCCCSQRGAAGHAGKRRVIKRYEIGTLEASVGQRIEQEANTKSLLSDQGRTGAIAFKVGKYKFVVWCSQVQVTLLQLYHKSTATLTYRVTKAISLLFTHNWHPAFGGNDKWSQ